MPTKGTKHVPFFVPPKRQGKILLGTFISESVLQAISLKTNTFVSLIYIYIYFNPSQRNKRCKSEIKMSLH